jgi:hypothetical protein
LALYKFSRQTRACGTCDYWYGCRKLDSIWAPMYVIVEGAGAEEIGVCGHRKSGWWNQKKKSNMSCPKWELFARLKNL